MILHSRDLRTDGFSADQLRIRPTKKKVTDFARSITRVPEPTVTPSL